jgi:uncharacterized protein (UPF0332 family)
MNSKERILLENYEEYYNFALEALKRRKYNSATTLFFKSIVALCDLHILMKTGLAPSSHTSRFRIMEEKFPELYIIADKDFPFYQDSYSKKMGLEEAQMLKEDAEKIKKIIETLF